MATRSSRPGSTRVGAAGLLGAMPRARQEAGMSWVLRFAAKGAAPSAEDVDAYLKTRRHHDCLRRYDNPETGVSFGFESNGAHIAVLELTYNRPSVFALEADQSSIKRLPPGFEQPRTVVPLREALRAGAAIRGARHFSSRAGLHSMTDDILSTSRWAAKEPKRRRGWSRPRRASSSRRATPRPA